MTLDAAEIEKVQRYFENPDKGLGDLRFAFPDSDQNETPVSGKVLAQRLKGLISKEKADSLEQYINESCEQIDD